MHMQIIITEKYKGEHVIQCKHAEHDESYFWTALGHQNICITRGTAVEEARVVKWPHTVQFRFFPKGAQHSYHMIHLSFLAFLFPLFSCLLLWSLFSIKSRIRSAHSITARVWTNTVLEAGVCQQAMECFNMVMSSTMHPHMLSSELLRLPVQVTENASWQFQVNPQITSGKSRLFQTDGCVSSMNFSEFFFIKKNLSWDVEEIGTVYTYF